MLYFFKKTSSWPTIIFKNQLFSTFVTTKSMATRACVCVPVWLLRLPKDSLRVLGGLHQSIVPLPKRRVPMSLSPSEQQEALLTWLGSLTLSNATGTLSCCCLLRDIKVLFFFLILQVQKATQPTILSPVKGRSHTFWDILGKTDCDGYGPLRVHYG